MTAQPARQIYAIGDVCRALEAMGVPLEERTARSWREERIGLRLEGGEVGHRQLYTFKDLLRMAVMALIVKSGIMAGHAARFVNDTLIFWDESKIEFYVLVETNLAGLMARSVNSIEDVLAVLNPRPEMIGMLSVGPPLFLQIVPVHHIADMLRTRPGS